MDPRPRKYAPVKACVWFGLALGIVCFVSVCLKATVWSSIFISGSIGFEVLISMYFCNKRVPRFVRPKQVFCWLVRYKKVVHQVHIPL